MTQQIVLRSLEELGQFADVLVPAEPNSTVRALVPVPTEPDLAQLAETAGHLAQELQQIVAADSRARQEAEEALATYRRFLADAARLRSMVQNAEHVLERASALADEAFAPECRARAHHIVTACEALTTAARNRLTAIDAEAATISAREDVARVLVEERMREEAARREAEERQREVRVMVGIAQAELLARAQKFDEARRMLGQLLQEHPNDPHLASFMANIRRREWAVKASMAERTLRQAQRSIRQRPKEVIAVLETLDVAGLPDGLARQLYGCWLRACGRLGYEGTVHHSAAFCKGAVLAPTTDGHLEVVSAIGLSGWKVGRRFSRDALKGVRRLK